MARHGVDLQTVARLMAEARAGRSNQKRRTRKALLEAAGRLMREDRKPSLEEVAEEALVSRATAYRYFPTVEALLAEAALDIASPTSRAVFHGAPDDPVERALRVSAAFDEMSYANEASLRLMLASALERSVTGGDDAPLRQNRRTPMIEEALKPYYKEFRPADLKKLIKALALFIGTESMIVFKDVLQTDENDARAVKRWAIRALVDAARKQEKQ
ncbi:MAG: TetR/AcrR family transcriptional regulator [Amphiplicatus sp.]